MSIIKSNDFIESEFKIEATPDAFAILSDKLYSDKIKAVIRELSTNAVDAHAEANNITQKVKISLPTYNDQNFTIRDFGTGMSWKDMSRYTTYFASSKRNDITQTGKFGLGCKSPFAYTKSFTVTSFYNGLKYPYTMYIKDSVDAIYDDNGILIREAQKGGYPTSIYLGDKEEDGTPIGIPTDEPNGMQIVIPVEKFDIVTFERKTKDVLKYFDANIRPDIYKNNRIYDISLVEDKPLLSGNKWKIFSWGSTGTYQNTQSVAIIGNIGYPINLSKGDYPNAGITPAMEALLRCNLEILFDNDELEYLPSREGLQYNNKTLKRLINRLDTILTEICNLINIDIQSAQTLFEASCKAYSYSQIPQTIIDNTKLKWKNLNILPRLINLQKFIKDNPDFNITKYSRSYRGIKKSPPDYIPCHKNLCLFEKDVNATFDSRARLYLNSTSTGNELYLVTLPANVKQKFIDFLHIDSTLIKSITTLPKPALAVRNKKKRIKSEVYSIKNNSWQDTDIDIDKGGIYVGLYNYDVYAIDKTFNFHQRLSDKDYFSHDIKHIGNIFPGLIDTIVGFRLVKKEIPFNLNTKWQSLYSIVSNNIDKYFSKHENLVSYNTYLNNYKKIYNTYTPYVISSLLDVYKHYNTNYNSKIHTPFTKYIKFIKCYNDKNTSINYILNNILSKKIDLSKINTIDGNIESFNKEYPLASPTVIIHTNPKNMAEYIYLIEKEKKYV